MSLKFGLAAALFVAAAPLAAQPPAAAPQPAPTPQQAAIQNAGMAFGQCLSAAIQKAPASVTPEAAAAAALNGCATQRAELARSVDAMIATIPEAQRAAAHAAFESDMAQAQGEIAEAIRQQRAAPAAPATPATPPR